MNFSHALKATVLTGLLTGAVYVAHTYPWVWVYTKLASIIALLWVAFYGVLYAVEQEGKQTEWSGER